MEGLLCQRVKAMLLLKGGYYGEQWVGLDGVLEGVVGDDGKI